MRRVAITAALVAAALIIIKAVEHPQPRQIHIVGSSTVYPFVTAAAEMFGLNGRFPTPVVESTGTGGGFKIFCEGAGDRTPDINDASRAMLPSEQALCEKNSVGHISEIPLGYDGITLSSSVDAPVFHLTVTQLFLALARVVPQGDALVANPYQRWNEIDPSLPALPIQIYGPPPTSGTRDAMAELVMEKGCQAFPAFASAYPDAKAHSLVCRALREDGHFIEAGENGNLVIQKLQANPGALGVVGYSFLEENTNTVRAAAIDGVAPSAKAISHGSYPLSRMLYIYVKDAHRATVPGLNAFVQEITSDEAIGPDGYLVERGLLPLPQGR